MIADGLLLFSNGQVVTATADSTNVLDFGVNEDLGITERPLEVFIDWATAPIGSNAGTTTLAISLLTSADNATWKTVLTTAPVLTTNVAQGTSSPLDLPQGMMRYAKLNYAVASGSLTAGIVTAGLVLDADGGQKYYKRAYTA